MANKGWPHLACHTSPQPRDQTIDPVKLLGVDTGYAKRDLRVPLQIGTCLLDHRKINSTCLPCQAMHWREPH